MPATARARPGAVDPRLLRYARATRPFLVALIVLGVLTALLIIAQAWLLADVIARAFGGGQGRSEEHTSELQHPSISYAVFCLKKKKKKKKQKNTIKKKKKKKHKKKKKKKK